MLDILIHKWLKRPYLLHVYQDIKPRKYRATVVMIHGIGTSGAIWKDITDKLPGDVRILSIDLLGFGGSPKPRWATYDAKTQARSVMATLRRLHIRRNVILVGHSLGALVSVEIVTKFRLLPRQLILLSPPFYQPDKQRRNLIPNEEKVLKDIYRAIRSRPDQFLKISKLATYYGLVDKEYALGDDSLEAYMSALEASIINQTAYTDALLISCPTTILRGRFDPVVVHRNLRSLAKKNPHISLKNVVAGHTIVGKAYKTAVIKEISDALPRKTDTSGQQIRTE